jgi:hypothetical protein
VTLNGRTILSFAAVAVLLALDLLLISYLIARPLSFASALSLCIALTAALAIIVLSLSGLIKSRWSGFGDVAQGLAAISAIVAFIVAADIYFLERKDKPRIEFDVTATRSLVMPPHGRASVLLGIRVLVTNNGNRQVELKCVTLDIFRPTLGQSLARNPGAPEEMMLETVPGRIPYPRRFDTNCLRQEELRKHLPHNSVRPLYAWSPLTLEPGEPDDGYFEIPVSCDYPFVRVLVKIRLSPGDELGYETKAIIPLREICEGHAEGIEKSVIAERQSGPESQAQPQVAAAAAAH